MVTFTDVEVPGTVVVLYNVDVRVVVFVVVIVEIVSDKVDVRSPNTVSVVVEKSVLDVVVVVNNTLIVSLSA